MGLDDVNSHWNYQKGDSVIVEIYSNCDEVELFVNGKSMGKKYIDDFEDHIYNGSSVQAWHYYRKRKK
mgnify:CR=1 FL=1